jgi:hypothetical protein
MLLLIGLAINLWVLQFLLITLLLQAAVVVVIQLQVAVVQAVI